MQHFIQRRYPMVVLKGLHREQDFREMAASLDNDPDADQDYWFRVKLLVDFQNQRPNISVITRSLWERDEQAARNVLNEKADLRKNTTFLTCLNLFKNIFDEIRKSTSIYDLF